MRRTGGFTLLELMVAVAILGILAGVLVYSFTKPTNSVRTSSEANAMFAELHRAETQYAVEHGVYLSTGADESDLFPDNPGRTAQAADDPPDEWDDLHARAQTAKLYCGYVAIAGTKDDDIPDFAIDFGMEQPESNWYVLYGRCDVDGSSTKDAVYFSSSVDTSLKKTNEGH